MRCGHQPAFIGIWRHWQPRASASVCICRQIETKVDAKERGGEGVEAGDGGVGEAEDDGVVDVTAAAAAYEGGE